MKKVEIHFYISRKAFFGRNYRRICRFWANLAHFCEFLAPILHPLWLFMVVFASSRIIINEIGGNPLLYIDKKHFLDQIREKNANFERFWPIFVSFWPLIGPKLFCFCFHYLFREKLDQNDMSHAMFVPSIYIFIVFEASMFQEMTGYTGRSTLPQVTHYTR